VSATPAGLSLSAEEDQAFRRGVAQFNRGEYFECHDTLEEVWAGVRGSGRDFLQGLIQVSVAFYHLGNANPAGARSMFGRALARWRPYPDRRRGRRRRARCPGPSTRPERLGTDDAELRGGGVHA
jgi:predicted metal-dependent hydrolase